MLLKLMVMTLMSFLNAIETAESFTEGQHVLIIMHTVKGKGVEEMEGQAGWHGKAPNWKSKV